MEIPSEIPGRQSAHVLGALDRVVCPADLDQVFKIRADGGGRLFVNGQKLFDDWNNPPLPPNKSGPTPAFTGEIHLQAGQNYSVQIDYHQVPAGS